MSHVNVEPATKRQHVAGIHLLIDVYVQRLDDAVRLRLDFDLRDRFDLARGDDRLYHRAALHDGDA